MKQLKEVMVSIITNIKIIGILKKLIILLMGGVGLISILFIQPIFKVTELPNNPDYVVVLGGGGGRRVEFLVTLIQDKYKNMPVFMTGGILSYGKTTAAWMMDYGRELGLSQPIILIDTSQSTFDDAKHLRKYIYQNQLNVKSLLIVTSDYHTGRSFWVFNHVFPDVNISIVGAPDKLTNPFWWRDYNLAQFVLEEKARFLFYRLVLLFRPSTI